MGGVKQGKSVRKNAPVKQTNIKRVIIAITLALIGLGIYTVAYQYTHQAKLEADNRAKQTQIQKQLKDLQDTTNRNAEQQKQIEELTKQLQAKKDGQARALAEAPVSHVQPAVAVSGTCADWMSVAGITDTYNATILLNKESHCNPNAVNRSSGACGLAQELPCGKSGCSLGDGACQMAWMNRYVLGRYGSWANAVAFHLSHNWY